MGKVIAQRVAVRWIALLVIQQLFMGERIGFPRLAQRGCE
jgi:hypothetical protein